MSKKKDNKRRPAPENDLQFLATVVNGLDDPVFAKDEQHRWVLLNDAAVAVMGKPREELLGRSDYDLFPKDQADVFWAKDQEVLDRGKTVVNEEEITWHGKPHIISTKKTLLLDENGAKFIIGTIRDITERRRMEQALINSETEFRTLVENVNFGIYRNTGGPHGKFLKANPAIAEMFGYDSVKEFMQVSVSDLYQNAEDRRAFVEAALENGYVKDRELRLKKKDGTPIWGACTARIKYDADGNIMWLDGVIEDITERKEAEAEIHLKRDRAQQYLDIVASIILALDCDGNIELLNAGGAELLGCTAEDAVGRNWFDHFIPEEDGFWLREGFARLLTDDPALERVINNIVTADGEQRLIQWHNSLVRAADGTVVGTLSAGEDITDVDEAKRQLRESRSQLQALFDNMMNGFAYNRLLRDEDGAAVDYVFVEINPAFCRLTGLTHDEVVGRRATAVFPDLPEAEFDWIETFAQVAETGEPLTVEQYFAPLGRWFSVQVYRPIMDHFAAIFEDISARKEAEKELLQSEHRFRQLFAQANDAVFLHLLSGEIINVNSKACELLGRERRELLTMSMTDLYPRDCFKAARAASKTVEHQGDVRFESKLRHQDGHDIDVEISASIMDPATGLVQGIVRDITERRRANEAIRSLARFASENPYPVLRIDRDGVLLYANPAAELLLRTAGMAVGGTVADDWQRLTREALAAENTIVREIRCDDRVFSLTLTPVDDAGYINVYGADITGRRMLESQLRQQQKLDAIGTLAGGVAHEINNPINGIMNYAQLIKDRLGEDHQLTEFAGEIINETNRVATIVRNLLTFARWERQERTPTAVTEIVDATLSLVRTILRRDQIELRLNLPDDLPPLPCRSQQIQQVLMNLLTNARDALNEKYPDADEDKEIVLQAETFTEDDAQWLRLSVRDHGPGVSEDIQDRVFDPFFTTKPRGIGTGLGLSITHGIVREHGGRIRIQTEPGEFTEFQVELPLDPDASPLQRTEGEN